MEGQLLVTRSLFQYDVAAPPIRARKVFSVEGGFIPQFFQGVGDKNREN